MERGIWIDCDIALGVPFRDPDDGFALAAVALRRDVPLLGVSTVFGNTTVARSTASARRLLDVADRRDVTVVEDTARAGITTVTAAAEAIAALPDGASLLALGPLTNVAAALLVDPGLAARIEVRAVGGNRSSWGRWAPIWPFEFNLAKDPLASHAFFAAPFRRRRLFPLDVARHLTVGARDLAHLARRGPVGAALARGALSWLAYAPLRYRALSFPLWDLLPALDALGALDVTVEERALGVAGRGRLVPGGPRSEWATAFHRLPLPEGRRPRLPSRSPSAHSDRPAALRAFLDLLPA